MSDTATLTRTDDAAPLLTVREIYEAAEAALSELGSLNLRPERRATIESLLTTRSTSRMKQGLKMVAADKARQAERRAKSRIVTQAAAARYEIGPKGLGLEWFETGLGDEIMRLLSSDQLDDKQAGLAMLAERRNEATTRIQREELDAAHRAAMRAEQDLIRTMGFSTVPPKESNRSRGKGRHGRRSAPALTSGRSAKNTRR